MSHRRPTVACLLFSLYYKPFTWCSIDARLWHAGYFFYLQALYVVSLRRPTEAGFIFYPFRGVASDTRSMHYISTPVLHIHILPACVHHGFRILRDRRYGRRIFRSMITPCYIIPVFLMFASTFKRTHWLVPGYCLGQISRMERALRRQPRNPCKGNSSLAKIGVILVSCSCGKWSPIDTDEPQTASAINH